jgi:hypothetical protein
MTVLTNGPTHRERQADLIQDLQRPRSQAASPWPYLHLASLDLTLSFVLALALAAAILFAQHQAEANVVPFPDGSAHVSGASNLASSLRTEGPSAFWRNGLGDVTLAHSLFAVASLAVGNGRFAFGVGWAVLVAALLASIWILFRDDREGLPRSITFGVLLMAGLFQSPRGGAFDARIDLLSATLCLFALAAVVSRYTFATLGFAIAACYAKGAALALIVPITLVSLVLGFLPLGSLLPRPVSVAAVVGTFLKLACAAAASTVFWVKLAPNAVSYNLMATGADGTSDRVAAFVANLWTYFWRDPLFYVKDLVLHSTVFVIGPAALLLLLVGVRQRWPTSLLRVGGLAVGAFVYSILLLTVNPLHSDVLTIWLLPSVGLMAVFIGSTLSRSRVPIQIVLIVVAVAAGLGVTTRSAGAAPTPADQQNADAVFRQAGELASFLNQRFDGQATEVAIVTNFLYRHGSVQSDFNAYRVLVHERLRSPTFRLQGWEFGGANPDWRYGLAAARDFPHVVLVLEENAGALSLANAPQRAGREVWEYFQRFADTHPRCLEEAAAPVTMEPGGRRLVLLLADTPECRNLLREPLP